MRFNWRWFWCTLAIGLALALIQDANAEEKLPFHWAYIPIGPEETHVQVDEVEVFRITIRLTPEGEVLGVFAFDAPNPEEDGTFRHVLTVPDLPPVEVFAVVQAAMKTGRKGEPSSSKPIPVPGASQWLENGFSLWALAAVRRRRSVRRTSQRVHDPAASTVGAGEWALERWGKG